MNYLLHNLTITSIKRDKANLAVAESPTINDVELFSQSIIDKLTTLFNTNGLRTGRFNESPRPDFANTLDRHLKTDGSNFDISTFEVFSTALGVSLAKELNNNQAKHARDGFLLIYNYSTYEEDDLKDIVDSHVNVVFLHRLNGVNISNQLTLEDIEQINLDSLNLGASVSLSTFIDETEDPDERSILFKIGRGSDVRVYFQNFIGCEEPSDPKAESTDLLKAIESVCGELQLTENASQRVTEKASSYCKGLINSGEHKAELSNLASFIFSNSEHADRFIVVAQNTYRLSEYVGLDKSVINKFGDIIAKTDAYRVTIKKEALSVNRTVRWDSKTEELTITGLPSEAINQLNNLFSRRD